MLVQLAGHVQLAAARLRRATVRRHIDHDLQLHVVVDLAVADAGRPEQIQELPHAGFADVHALLPHLDRAVVGEEIGDVVPHAPVEVVAVDLLQVFDFLLVGEPLRALRERLRAITRGRLAPRRRQQRDRSPGVARVRDARVRVVERTDARGREARARFLARLVRRIRQVAQPAAAAACTRRSRWPGLGRHPARRVRRAEARVVIEVLDLPHAVVLRVRHLVHALCPRGAAAEAAEHRERAPTPFRALTARVEVDDRLDVDVVVDSVLGKTIFTDLAAADVHVQVLADARLADVRAGGIVRDGVVGVEIGDVFPHALVDVVAVLALEALQRAQVLGGGDLRFERIEARVERSVGLRLRFSSQQRHHSACGGDKNPR